MKRFGSLLFVAFATAGVSAQNPAPTPVRFEAASIKPTTSTETGTFIRQNSGGRFTAENITVFNLIQQAYGLFGFQIIDAPGWLERDRFDIQAIAPGTSFAQQGPLLQKLLEERFAFRARRETRDGEIYALVIARADGRLGPNLRPFTGDCAPAGGVASPCTMHNGPTFTNAVGMPLSIIVGQATGNVRRIVVDKTGLTGRFDFTYKWATDPALTAGDDRVSFVTALQEQLGLRLEPQRAPIEILVIERVERPSPN